MVGFQLLARIRPWLTLAGLAAVIAGALSAGCDSTPLVALPEEDAGRDASRIDDARSEDFDAAASFADAAADVAVEADAISAAPLSATRCSLHGL
jgi:hypothetical protein